MILVLLYMICNSEKVIDLRYSEVGPKIDGCIEDLWQVGDSLFDFVQVLPYEDKTPSENTIVHLLQDRENLYVAFRCYTATHRPISDLTQNDDHVTLYVDPFESKTTAYFFKTCASGLINDGMYLDDGRSVDKSWDGVWYHAEKTYNDRYEIEIRIPFKTIRYKKGSTLWGINFKRYLAHCAETDFWTGFTQKEGLRVSSFGQLTSVKPESKSYYFEIYPEGFVRYDKLTGGERKIKPRASLNLKWDVTPQGTINGTVFPDFAQIESDPFTLNLSRYATYLSERRPFFIEGSDIFRMSDFGEAQGIFTPVNLFYSRIIGKSLKGEPVQIIGGLKATYKTREWNLGALGAYTDSLRWDTLNTEPRRGFGVLRLKRKVLTNSDVGMLFSGSVKDRENYNIGVGLDGVYRSGANQFILQGAMSDRAKRRGWAISSGYNGFLRKFLTSGCFLYVQDSFDVNDIGYMPWAGKKQFVLSSGPYYVYPKGAIRNLHISPGVWIVQEPGDTNWSRLGTFGISTNLRNNLGLGFYVQFGPYSQENIEYFGRYVNFNIWKQWVRSTASYGTNVDYGYNYYRGFLAYMNAHWFSFEYIIIPRIRFSITSTVWIETDTRNKIVATTPMGTPRFDFMFTSNMSLGIFNELVLSVSETSFSEMDITSNRFGFLFSWNFQPKSWFYVAFNDYQELGNSGLQPLYRIGAIKAKYLLYF